MMEILGVFTQLVAWVGTLLSLAVALVALVKLRTTPSGILLALGFGGLGLKSLAFRCYTLLVLQPAVEDGSGDALEMLPYFMLLTNGIAIFCAIMVGVGGLLLPSSLKRL